jgi:hypothetical protein
MSRTEAGALMAEFFQVARAFSGGMGKDGAEPHGGRDRADGTKAACARSEGTEKDWAEPHRRSEATEPGKAQARAGVGVRLEGAPHEVQMCDRIRVYI